MKTELPYRRPGCDHDGPCWTVSYDDCWGIGIRDEHRGDSVWFSTGDADHLLLLGALTDAVQRCRVASYRRELEAALDEVAEAAEDAAAEMAANDIPGARTIYDAIEKRVAALEAAR